jgi:hypothetical protein
VARVNRPDPLGYRAFGKRRNDVGVKMFANGSDSKAASRSSQDCVNFLVEFQFHLHLATETTEKAEIKTCYQSSN